MSERRGPRRRPGGRLGAVVLAAGRSKRFRGTQPKVLHPLCGRSILEHVLGALREVHRSEKVGRVVVVVPPGKQVEASIAGLRVPFEITFAVQREPTGTGAATHIGLKRLGEADEVLVLAGDVPLVRPQSLVDLVRARRDGDAAAAVLTATLDDGGPYGRILRVEGSITGIVEARDATPDQLQIREINTCIMSFRRDALERALPRLRADNAQKERYLTDTVGELIRSGERLTSVEGSPTDVLGTNTRSEFALVARHCRERIVGDLMDAGVTVIDPSSVYVDAGVSVGADTTLHPNTYLQGATAIGAGCEIGPATQIVDSSVGDGASVTFAKVVGSKVGTGATVGPFASLRAGTTLRAGAKAGTFVETKAADIGEDSAVPHLSYMGDVRIGRGTNIGAGTITCNYNPFELAPDGSTKHRTVIGDDAYISSDTMLVAPVTIGDGAQTGAGSVVTRNVKAGELVYGSPARSRGKAKRKVAKRKSSAKRSANDEAPVRKRKSQGKGRGG